MGFFDRLKALFGGGPRKGTGFEVSRYISAPPRRGTQQLLQAYREQPLLRAITEKISDNVACAQWRAYRPVRAGIPTKAYGLRYAPPQVRKDRIKAMLDAGEAVEVPDHPFLRLLTDPNDLLTGRATWKLCQTHLDLPGETFLAVERGPANMPISLWPVPPSWVVRTPDYRLPRSEWAFTVAVGGVQQTISAENMLHLRHPDPEDPLGRGVGPAFTLGDELDTDEYAARFCKNAFFNNMTPSSVISIDGAPMTETPAIKAWKEDLKREHRGPENAGKLLVTSGKASIARLDTPLKDLQFVELRKFLRDFVRMTYGVPPEIIGDVTNSNKATAFAAREILAEQVIVPRLEFWRTEMQKRLLPAFDETTILDYDSPVPADRDHQLAVMSKMPEAFSYDEWRGLAGFKPDPSRQGYPMPLPGQKPTDGAEPEGDETPMDPPDMSTKSDPPWARKPFA